MTVSSTTNRKTFTGDDATTSFDTTPIVFFATSDLQVYVTTTATGVTTLLTEGTHYTVSGGDESVGAVGSIDTSAGSSPHGALATGTTLVVLRELPLLQGTDFVQNDASDAEVAEAALDKLVLQQQRLNDRLDRTFQLSDGDVSGADVTMPEADARASKALGFDADGDLALFDPASAVTASENVTFVQSGSGATARTMQGKARDFVNLADFIGDAMVLDGSVDYTTQLAAAIAALPTQGGEVRFPCGRVKCNVTVTRQNIRFKSTSLSRSSSLNTQLVPAVLANPVLQVGDGTTACVGFQTDGVVLEGSGTGAIGLKILGANMCSFRNFSAQGFTDANVRINSSATIPTFFIFFDVYDIAADSSASSIGLDVAYGSQYVTAIYFNEGTIGAQAGSLYAVQVTGATILNLSNTWVQVASSGHGISLATDGSIGKICGSNLVVDSSSSSDTLVTLDANTAITDVIYGSGISIDGKITMPGGTTATIGKSLGADTYKLLNYAQIGQVLDFCYSANVWNALDQKNDGKCRIFRSSADALVLDVSSAAAGSSIDLRPNATGAVIVRSSGTATLQLIGSGGTANITQGANDLTLAPVSGHRVAISGGNLFLATGFGIESDVQATVGAAGAASALPGAPTGYAKLVSVSGIEYVVPYWAAA